MKKTVINLFITASMLLLLAACGSDSKPDAQSFSAGDFYKAVPTRLDYQPNDLSFHVLVPLTKKVGSEATVKLSNFKLILEGCEIENFHVTPDPAELKGALGTQILLQIDGTVKQACEPSAYRLIADQTVSVGEKSRTDEAVEIISTQIDGNGNPVGGYDDATNVTTGSTEYLFKNAKSITVPSPSYEDSLSVDLVDKNGVGVPGKTVKATVLPLEYGSLTNTTAVTDQAGRAFFAYVGPGDIDALEGQSQPVMFIYEDEQNQTIKTTASIFFHKSIDAVEGNVSKPIVVIPSTLRNIVVDENGASVSVSIRVYKDLAPYTQGSIKVKLPEKAVENSIDVGSFRPQEASVDDTGVAQFTYTAPGDIAALIAAGDTGSTFKFYHTENPEDEQEWHVIYNTPQDQNINRNYAVEVTTGGEDFSMGIPNIKKTFSVALKAVDSSGSPVSLDREKILKITAKTTNATVAQILNNNTLVDSLELPGSTFTLQSKKLSGLVPVEVTIEFEDANGNPMTLTKLVNVRVMSGPPSAISISYVSTTQDAQRAKYIETMAISVTDEYGNKVNTHPNITVGAIAGYAVDGRESSAKESNETKRLFYGRRDIENGSANGEIIPAGTNKATFTATPSGVFKYVGLEGINTDKLVTFGAGKNYEAMGKWDFVKSNDSTLDLEDEYYGIQRDKLYYAVGHNYYQDQCRQDGREWIGSTDAESYVVDDQGSVLVKYSYDYHLAGKDVLFWVNLNGIQPDTGEKTKIGEVVKHTLRSTGLTKAPSNGYSLEKGASGYGTFIIWHANAPERYRNAHFGYAIKSGSTCQYSVVATSNTFDARTCDTREDIDADGVKDFGTTDGTAYVTFFLQAPEDKACTFDITNILVSDEF
jgi:hypothetical protein